MHQYRLSLAETFNTVQIGAYDGYRNDLFAAAFFKQPYSQMTNWNGVLIEPVPGHMELLKSNYRRFSNNSTTFNFSSQYFLETIISDQCVQDSLGRKVSPFYIVRRNTDTCNSPHEWLEQISGVHQTILSNELKEHFDDCTIKMSLRCASIVDLIWEMLQGRDAVVGAGMPTVLCCTEDNSQNIRQRNNCQFDCGGRTKLISLPIVDVFLVDAEGSDDAIVRMILTKLCPALWPAIIIYEDKVGRYHNQDSNGLLKLLFDNDYYTILLGEDVIAIRVSYKNRFFDQMTFHNRYRQRCCRNKSIASS